MISAAGPGNGHHPPRRSPRPVLAAVFVALTACAAFTAAAGSPLGRAAIDTALERAAAAVRQHTGRSLEDVPAACEVETHPEDGQVLVLCTLCYRLAPGETCR